MVHRTPAFKFLHKDYPLSPHLFSMTSSFDTPTSRVSTVELDSGNHATIWAQVDPVTKEARLDISVNVQGKEVPIDVDLDEFLNTPGPAMYQDSEHTLSFSEQAMCELDDAAWKLLGELGHYPTRWIEEPVKRPGHVWGPRSQARPGD